MSVWSDAGRLAVGTLTRWPVRPPEHLDASRAGGAMLLAPLVGLALGTAGAAVAWLAQTLALDEPVTAVLVVAGWALASRGLHLDGLADTADGLGSGRPATEALELMRRGDVGPVGAATLALVLLGQVTALAQSLATWGPTACLVAGVASRLALPLACRRGVPAARSAGLGAAVAGSVPPVAAAAATAGVAVLAALVTVPVGGAVRGPAPVWAATTVLAAASAALALGRLAVSRLGGVSGDVLGWLVELCLLTALVTLAVASGTGGTDPSTGVAAAGVGGGPR